MLGPQFDEDNLILEEVSGSDAAYHFLTIFWKVLFAAVPPTNYCKGKAAFIVSLIMIGLVTAIVGEIAALLGCVLGIQ
jgi:solute carrier family 8 (sodium/calcium exchanger)